MRALTYRFKKSAKFALSLLAVLSISGIASSVPAKAHDARARNQVSLAEPKQNDGQKSSIEGDGSGTLLAMLPGGRQLGSCPLKHTDVKASVSGYVGRVSVKQTFQNTFKDKIEAVYTFPLPENAAVDEMTMKIGNRIIKGDIKKREEARQIYDNARAQGQVASLLDQERSNIFTQSVANIEPGAQVEIEIKYVDVLPYEAGSYTFNFPTVVGPRFIPGQAAIGHSGRGRANDTDAVPDASRITPPLAAKGERAGHDISIAIDIDAGLPIQSLKSDLHEIKSTQNGSKAHIELLDKNTIPNRDFVMHWAVAADKLQSGYLTHRDGKSGFFTIMMMPPKKVTADEVAPKEMVFLVDCSGSQSGSPLDKAKETLSYIVDHMNPQDTFQVVAFSDTQNQFAAHPQPASPEMKKRAKEFISSLQANGGTWMAPAVERVCAMPNDDHRLRIVTFMTDGYIGNDMEVLGLIKKYRGKSRWFSFGTGNSVNRFLIDGIAREGGGEADYVLLNSPQNVVGKKFYDRISSPVLTDVKVEFNGLEVKEVFPHDISDVWAEKPLYIKGRYLKPGAGTISLTGYAGGKPYKQDLKVIFPEKQSENEVIKPIWARAKVDRLMSEDWFGAQKGSVNREIKDEIVKTALDYHIMTQYTSFVAVEKRITKGGAAVTVDVPVEVPDGVSREMTAGDEENAVMQSRTNGKVYSKRAPRRSQANSYNGPIASNGGAGIGGGGGGGGTGAGYGASFGAVSAPSMPSPTPMSMPQAPSFSAGQLNTASISKSKAYSSPREIHIVDSRPMVKDFRQRTDAFKLSMPEPKTEAGKAATAEEKSDSENESFRTIANSKLSKSLINFFSAYHNGIIPKAEGITVTDGKINIKITLSSLDESVIKKLKSLGLEVLVRNQKEKSLVARIKIANIEQLCQYIEVLKVEPAQANK